MSPAAESPPRGALVTWVAVLCAVALGASTIYFALEARAARRQVGREPAADEVAAPAASRGPAPAAGRSDDELRRLRAENQMLRLRLLAAEPAAASAPRRHDGGVGGWRARLEALKTRDPERYKRIMERREQRRAMMASSLQDQLAQLDLRLDALGDSPAERKEADLLNSIAEVMGRISELGDKWQALAQLSDEERAAQAPALMEQSRALYQQLADLRMNDRQNQLTQLGGQLGLSADQTRQLTGEVERIVKETDMRPLRPRGPGGRGRPQP
jgi:hypothetical protein